MFSAILTSGAATVMECLDALRATDTDEERTARWADLLVCSRPPGRLLPRGKQPPERLPTPYSIHHNHLAKVTSHSIRRSRGQC